MSLPTDPEDQQALAELLAPYPAMGWLPDEGAFRLRAPLATFCEIVFRDHPDGDQQIVVPMQQAPVGPDQRPAWQARVVPPLPCYRFRVHHRRKTFDIADPWATHVVRRKRPGHPAWAIAQKTEPFAWRGDDGVQLHPDDAIICEAHVADLTAHPSAGCRWPGTFAGLVETHPAAVGGLPHVMRLGADAVELLPVASWAVQETRSRVNHWGYMPSHMRATCDYLGQAWHVAEDGEWVGIDAMGRPHDPGDELRAAIRDMHARGTAVILDVVYNHVSLHDNNPLLLLDPGTWFRRDRKGQRTNHSGCGNDLATEDPDMRALVLHSVAHWLRSYHVDGLRLDLAELIDDETLRLITDVALTIRPDTLLIAEPWSFRNRRLEAISELGYTVWNDTYRWAIKGRSTREPGFVFGGDAGPGVRAALAGSTVHDGGTLAATELSLNYLESHDNETFGDFARLAMGEVHDGEIVTRSRVRSLSGEALRVHKLAAATLLASRGPVMIAQGQSFARAKVVGGKRGRLNANSYDRPDGTNHIHWSDRAANPELVAWWARWVALRKSLLLPAWEQGVEPLWLQGGRKGIGFVLDAERPVAVLLNSDPHHEADFDLGQGAWQAMVGSANVQVRQSGHATLARRSAALLVSAR